MADDVEVSLLVYVILCLCQAEITLNEGFGIGLTNVSPQIVHHGH